MKIKLRIESWNHSLFLSSKFHQGIISLMDLPFYQKLKTWLLNQSRVVKESEVSLITDIKDTKISTFLHFAETLE